MSKFLDQLDKENNLKEVKNRLASGEYNSPNKELAEYWVREKDNKFMATRYWITTGIAVVALLLSLAAFLCK